MFPRPIKPTGEDGRSVGGLLLPLKTCPRGPSALRWRLQSGGWEQIHSMRIGQSLFRFWDSPSLESILSDIKPFDDVFPALEFGHDQLVCLWRGVFHRFQTQFFQRCPGFGVVQRLL